MKDVRTNLTNDEKIAFNNANGNDFTSFNMSENSIDELIQKEKSRKFNSELEKFQEDMDNRNKEMLESQEQLNYDIDTAEIKPVFSRLLVKPFKQNPFQKMEISNGIIVSAGGYTPHAQVNPISGKYEEQDQFILTGYVVEVGPEVKYLQEGDVIYYRKDTAVPVPFLNWNLISINENQVIAAVNESLTKRFNKLK